VNDLPFGEGPDPTLGAALRRALDAGDERRFVTGVLAALDAARPRAWDVLGHWARRGLLGAAAAALVAGLLLARAGRRESPDQLDEAFAAAVASGGAPAELAAGAPPDPSIVLATLDER